MEYTTKRVHKENHRTLKANSGERDLKPMIYGYHTIQSNCKDKVKESLMPVEIAGKCGN